MGVKFTTHHLMTKLQCCVKSIQFELITMYANRWMRASIAWNLPIIEPLLYACILALLIYVFHREIGGQP